jgi:hypothetical protein
MRGSWFQPVDQHLESSMFFVSTLSFQCPVVRLTVGNYLRPGSGIANRKTGMVRRQCACMCTNLLKASRPVSALTFGVFSFGIPPAPE